MSSTPEQRATARDYWSSPEAARLSEALDWTAAVLLTLAIFVAGSLNF